MTLNTVSKGSRWELRVKKQLESWGYSVEKVVNLPYKKMHDFFGVADLLASNRKSFRMIAVTSRSNVARSRKRMIRFTNHPKFVRKEVWSYDKKGDIKVEEVR